LILPPDLGLRDLQQCKLESNTFPQGVTLEGEDELDRLVSRSRLLGRDRRVVNYGGGNTSIKVGTVDHRGRPVECLWIKGSGSDLATIRREQFTPLRLADLRELESRKSMTDEEMVEYVALSSLDPAAPRASIEAVLHAFLPFPHVDHTHPEVAIAFCCCERGQAVVRDCFGESVVWVPYVRPGFQLAKLAIEALRANPTAEGMFLEKHGLVTWGHSGEESFDRTSNLLARGRQFLDSNSPDAPSVDASPQAALGKDDDRMEYARQILPRIRGWLARRAGNGIQHRILHFDPDVEVVEFLAQPLARERALTGAACPDHVMFTKFKPAFVDVGNGPLDAEVYWQAVHRALEEYVEWYRSFFEEGHRADVAMLSPTPNVILIPGLGMVTAGADMWSAKNTAALYRSAIRIMRWASSIGAFVSLSPQEAWDIEYWPLELYKLSLRPAQKRLAGRIALITGGAGAIGRASVKRLLQEDAHVAIVDANSEALETLRVELETQYPDRVRTIVGDVTLEQTYETAERELATGFGGCDIFFANAGIAAANPVEDISLQEWEHVQAVLTRGYFLAARSAFRLLKRQGIGGALAFNASKNGLAPGTNALAYTTAKAAELHMARCLAEEGGPDGIRVNAIAPDAVIAGSGLWTDEWKRQRAQTYGFELDEIDDFYRQRNALKVTIRAEDVAEALLFLVSDASSRTTGCIITVDGGVSGAYPR
jgi:rhamnulose-1-phosphate aldolase/alcohol dehydrogenase